MIDLATVTERARTEAQRAGAEAERERWRVVIASPEAKYKYQTALSILKHTDLNADAVRNILADLGQGSA